jgi:hypothetical protein
MTVRAGANRAFHSYLPHGDHGFQITESMAVS